MVVYTIFFMNSSSSVSVQVLESVLSTERIFVFVLVTIGVNTSSLLPGMVVWRRITSIGCSLFSRTSSASLFV